jgi:chaperonin GroEL
VGCFVSDNLGLLTHMVYRPKIDQKLCFVLMPFGPPFDGYYQKIIKPAANKAGLDALRSDEIYSTKAIIQDIWSKIWQASVIVADVTRKNPNVNYELGLCHALGIPTIIITRNIDDVPFDYRHRRCITYKVEDAGWEDKLRADLAGTIAAVMADTTNADELDWPYNTNMFEESPSGSVLIASGDARKTIIRGAEIVRNAIAGAFGPLGARVSVAGMVGSTIPVHRGNRIAQGIKSADPLEEKGIEEIRRVTSSVFGLCGDGTKLAAIVAAGFMTKGQELIERQYHPQTVLNLFDKALERVLGRLSVNSQQPNGATLKAVARTAAHGDKRAGEMVFEAMKKAGKDGVIAIETSHTAESNLELFEGMRIDRGYISEQFITHPDRQEAVLENCFVLIHERKISSMKDLLPVLEEVAKLGRSLLIIAEDVDGEALSTLVVNKLRGTLLCVAVKSPGFADRRRHLLEDIAVLTGSKPFMNELGIPLERATARDLGKAEKVIVTRDDTTIIGGGGSPQAISDRARTIRTQIETAANAMEQEKLQERLAMLVGSVAVLKAGGVTDVDVTEELYKLESAMHSARSAIEHGCVPGGGVALFRAAIALDEWKAGDELELAVKQSILSVLEEPISRLIENVKRSPTQMLEEIRKSSSMNVGFNTTTGKIEDLMEAGIVDSVWPLRQSLQVAFSHARAVLQTSTWDMSAQPKS